MELPSRRTLLCLAAWTAAMLPGIAYGSSWLAAEMYAHGYSKAGGIGKPTALIALLGLALAALGRPQVRLAGVGILSALLLWAMFFAVLAVLELVGILGWFGVD